MLMRILSLLCLLFSILAFTSCKKNCNETVATGDDPNFTIVSHCDSGFKATNRKVVVFGIPIYAYAEVDDARLLHAANIMAQYLDNDEDGTVDNPVLLTALTGNEAALFMWKKEGQIRLPAQDLGNDETILEWHTNGQNGRFDASLEEVFHVITHSGYANAYPEVFGESAGTEIANAMDIARGGNFTSIPNPYPAGAWYTYDDSTCDYGCMITEYIYWAMTSILGAQENRLDEIGQEWTLNTPELVETMDPAVYSLLTNPEYAFPTVLPDGTYMR